MNYWESVICDMKKKKLSKTPFCQMLYLRQIYPIVKNISPCKLNSLSKPALSRILSKSKIEEFP